MDHYVGSRVEEHVGWAIIGREMGTEEENIKLKIRNREHMR